MNLRETALRVGLLVVHAALFAGCNGGNGAAKGDAGSVSHAPPPAPISAPAPIFHMSAAAEVGREMFFDKNLSASRSMACATCHDPDHAYGPPNDLSVQLGGPDRTLPGLRAVPSLRYTEYTPAYADLLDNADGIAEPGAGGGFTWDGRADSLAEQAKLPLLSPVEMANTDAEDVVAKVKASSYAGLFVRAFGEVLEDTDRAFYDVLVALQSFQLEDATFHPYTSKFDLQGSKKSGVVLTPAEARGLQVFNDPSTGNCASCHFPSAGMDGSTSLFTDFSYQAIGVPRNSGIAANRDKKHTDMGLCGPLRADHKADSGQPNGFCGMFKTPTLRNVATRRAFFHNGVIHSLEQAVRFYNTRDTMPELWYPTVGGRRKAKPDADFPSYGLVTAQYVGGTVQKFDDLPAAHRGNIDKQLPLDGRAAGSKPPMTERQVLDLICFLETLTDDYKPGSVGEAGHCVE